MGSLILCVGKRIDKSFSFPGSYIELYTIEEICYYIFNYIDTMTRNDFDESLVEWLRGQQGLGEIAVKIERLICNQNSLKDIVVTLLCACDYYKEEDIRSLIQVIDQLENLSFYEKCRQKCNRFLENAKYKEAERFLFEIFKSEDAKSFSVEEYGNLLHNLAVIHIHTASYAEAAKEFCDAYERNHREESLKQYLTALLLSEQKMLYEKERIRLKVSDEVLSNIYKELEQNMKEAESSIEYGQLQRTAMQRNKGQISSYYDTVSTMIEKWKQEYKEEAIG